MAPHIPPRHRVKRASRSRMQGAQPAVAPESSAVAPESPAVTSALVAVALALLASTLALLWLWLPAMAQEPSGMRAATLPIGSAGGQIALPAEGIRIEVPALALAQTVEITLATFAPAPADWPAGLVVLGAWRLGAAGGGATPFAGFDAAWQATIRYGACADAPAPTFCAPQPIDEGSLHCLHQQQPGGAWLRVLGAVHALDKRLACSDAGAGDYLVAASPLVTSGESSTSTVLLLPIVRAAHAGR